MGDFELKKVPDYSGNTINVLEYKGRLWPDFPREAIAGFENFKLREDDVIVAAYPKSGTHWLFEIVRVLLEGTVEIPDVEKDDTMIEDSDHKVLEKMKGPRNLNSHCHFELLPRETFTKKPRLIYVTRDPRDLSVSYFNHHKKLVQYYQYNGEWKDYLPMFLDGKVDYESWFAYTKGWEEGIKNHPELSIHVTSYEKLHEDTANEIQKIAKYLGAKADPTFIKQVVKKASFDSMRQAKGANETFERKDGTSSPIMYRKGKVGDWKNWFTVAQSEYFNQIFEKEMKGTNAYELYSYTKQSSHGPDANMNQR